MNCPECGEVQHQEIADDESHCGCSTSVGLWCWCPCHRWNDDLRLMADFQADPLSFWEH